MKLYCWFCFYLSNWNNNITYKVRNHKFITKYCVDAKLQTDSQGTSHLVSIFKKTPVNVNVSRMENMDYKNTHIYAFTAYNFSSFLQVNYGSKVPQTYIIHKSNHVLSSSKLYKISNNNRKWEQRHSTSANVLNLPFHAIQTTTIAIRYCNEISIRMLF